MHHFIHDALVSINNRALYQALIGRQLQLFPPLYSGYHVELDVKGQIDIAPVRETAAIATIEATSKYRLARGGEGSISCSGTAGTHARRFSRYTARPSK